MNQAIQFPDREAWEGEYHAVCFPVLVNGFQLTCAIAGDTLRARYGSDEPEIDIFRAHRWDLEEEAEVLIKQQQEDAQGWVWLR
ncbi:hypothetical protein ED28_11525 [[Pantoea] beijingensis]|uniref:DUF1488 domain-containing protein n=1 Tax=[Pantoea] beijingensis TaxID=1324864 RepID=A0A443IDD4_9GAMM|nr:MULTISPECIES: DUF1488 domain-containing protein [Erwiniaceae]RWR01847.1 hypothetical protein ED28_11525 [[Pantoea] beijingensis]